MNSPYKFPKLFALATPLLHWNTDFAYTIAKLYCVAKEDRDVWGKLATLDAVQNKQCLLDYFCNEKLVQRFLNLIAECNLKKLVDAISSNHDAAFFIEDMRQYYLDRIRLDEFKNRNLVNLYRAIANRIDATHPSRLLDPMASVGCFGYAIGWNETILYESDPKTQRLGETLAQLQAFNCKFEYARPLYKPLENSVNADLVILTPNASNQIIKPHLLELLGRANFKISAIRTKRSEISYWIQYGLFQANSCGRVLVFAKDSWLSNGRNTSIRRYLINNDLVESMTLLPESFHPDAGRYVSVMLNKHKHKVDSGFIKFINARNHGIDGDRNTMHSDAQIQSLANLVVGNSQDSQIQKIPISDITESGFDLSPTR